MGLREITLPADEMDTAVNAHLTPVQGPNGELMGFIIPLVVPAIPVETGDTMLLKEYKRPESPIWQPGSRIQPGTFGPQLAHQYIPESLIYAPANLFKLIRSLDKEAPCYTLYNGDLILSKQAEVKLRQYRPPVYTGKVFCHPQLPEDSVWSIPHGTLLGRDIFIRTSKLFIIGMAVVDILHTNKSKIGEEETEIYSVIPSVVPHCMSQITRTAVTDENVVHHVIDEKMFQVGDIIFKGNNTKNNDGCYLHSINNFTGNVVKPAELSEIIPGTSDLRMLHPSTTKGYDVLLKWGQVRDEAFFLSIHDGKSIRKLLIDREGMTGEYADKMVREVSVAVGSIFTGCAFPTGVIVVPVPAGNGALTLKAVMMNPSILATLVLKYRLANSLYKCI